MPQKFTSNGSQDKISKVQRTDQRKKIEFFPKIAEKSPNSPKNHLNSSMGKFQLSARKVQKGTFPKISPESCSASRKLHFEPLLRKTRFSARKVRGEKIENFKPFSGKFYSIFQFLATVWWRSTKFHKICTTKNTTNLFDSLILKKKKIFFFTKFFQLSRGRTNFKVFPFLKFLFFFSKLFFFHTKKRTKHGKFFFSKISIFVFLLTGCECTLNL